MGYKRPTYGLSAAQRDITCGAIDEPSRSSKAIDKHIIINFCDINVVIACFVTKMMFFISMTKCHDMS